MHNFVENAHLPQHIQGWKAVVRIFHENPLITELRFESAVPSAPDEERVLVLAYRDPSSASGVSYVLQGTYRD